LSRLITVAGINQMAGPTGHAPEQQEAEKITPPKKIHTAGLLPFLRTDALLASSGIGALDVSRVNLLLGVGGR